MTISGSEHTKIFMDLSGYDRKYVLIRDIYGESFSGLARYEGREFLECEYGGSEDGIFIEDCLIYNSKIGSIEEIEVHGTAELWTENLILRRCRPEDAKQLYERFGNDPEMYRYTGWDPFASEEMAGESVRGIIGRYEDAHFYFWVMDVEDIVVGTIGAYDDKCGQTGLGFSVGRKWLGRGFATEALKRVLEYLTENEGIPCVSACCAEENAAARRVLEKAGMSFLRTEKDGITVEGRVYDKRIYGYST